MKWPGTGIAVVAVIASYMFFASGGTFAFRRVPPPGPTMKYGPGQAPYYPALAEAFLGGRLDLAHQVDPRWRKVVNAYDFESRAAHGLQWEMWDATLYRGKFYIYFSPLPVLLFYIPFRLLAGGYPPDALVALVACAWAFLVCVAFAARALRERATHVPFPLWVLLLGVANVVPYILSSVRAYEVAVATGMAMTASWAYALLRWKESGALRHAALMGGWAALAVVARPNLIVLVGVTAVALALSRNRRAVLGALIPMVVIGGTLAFYNFARFGSVVEFGFTYQLSYEPMWRRAMCSVCDGPELLGLFNNTMHYVFWAPGVSNIFPFIVPQTSVLDPAVSLRGNPETVVGVAALNPLVLLGMLCALLLARTRQAAIWLMAGAWLILLTLATCRWITARFSLDFMLLMTASSVVLIEEGLTLLDRAGLSVRLLRVFVVILACYAIAIGVLLGFRGPG